MIFIPKLKHTSFILFTLILTSCDVSLLGSSESSDDTNDDFTYRYPIVDTGQTRCYDETTVIDCPSDEDDDFYGQDGQYDGNQPSYSFYDTDTESLSDSDTDSGIVVDNVTGLMWQNSPESDDDDDITSDDKMDYNDAVDYCDDLTLGGFSDWVLPDIHKLYTLIMFYGTDPGEDDDEDDLIPFIDTDYFDFAYGDTDNDERIVDSQYASSTFYVASYDDDDDDYTMLFGVNFADGRIKGYETNFYGSDKTFFVMCSRNYDTSDLVELADTYEDNDDDTISDTGAGLMWMKYDSDFEDISDYTDEYDDDGYISGLNWEDALLWAQEMNDDSYLGYSDWRLPNAKELQALVDYTRSPDTTDSAAIDELFESTLITNEGGEDDYPFYWSSTTHADLSNYYDLDDDDADEDDDESGTSGVYVAFGRAMGEVLDDDGDGTGEYEDVHGAGAQRSDPKSGYVEDYPTEDNPQGDVTRIYNEVRLVRDID